MRRFSLYIVCAVCALCVSFASHALAEQISPPHAALKTSVVKILDFIKNPEYNKNKVARTNLNEQIKKEVYTIFDFDEFAMRTAGPRWRTFNDSEKKDFSEAFAELLFATYLSRVDGYNGEKFSYVGEVSDAKKTRYEIRTVVVLKSGQSIPVAYRMLPKNGTWRVYDVIIENISLVQNYRSQFSSILANDSPQELTRRVQERADALEVENNEGL